MKTHNRSLAWFWALICLSLSGIPGILFAQAQPGVDDMARASAKAFDPKVEYDFAQGPIKKIYVMFSAHWDFGYFDPDDVERDQLAPTVDNIIDLALADPDYRWSMEATWHIDSWLRSNPSQERIEQLFSLIRNGQISVGAMEQMTMSLPDEIVGRDVYQAADYADKYNVKFETAVACDYVGFSWAKIQPLARSGVKYLLNSHHPTFHPLDDIKMKDSPFWWEAPDGSRLLVWRTSYTGGIFPFCINTSGARYFNGQTLGPEAREMSNVQLTEVALKNELKKLQAEGYDKDAILVICSMDNQRPSTAVNVIAHMKEFNKANLGVELIACNPEDFFRHMQDKYGRKLPVYRGEYRAWFNGPNYAYSSGKRAALEMLDAEKYWGFFSLLGAEAYPDFYPKQRMQRQMGDLLDILAHGGGAWEASQLERDYTELRYAQIREDLVSRAHYMLETGVTALFPRIHTTSPSLAVVNTLSWKRSGIAELPVYERIFPKGSGLIDPATGKPVVCEWAPYEPYSGQPVQGRTLFEKERFRELGYAKIRFRAADVPGMGYKAFIVSPDTDAPADMIAESVTSTVTLENAFFRVSAGPNGDIVALYDKQQKKEFRPGNATEYFAQLRATIGSFWNQKTVELTGIAKAAAILRRGPVTTTLEIERPGDLLKRTEIILSEGLPEIRIRHYLDEAVRKEFFEDYWPAIHAALPLDFAKNRFQVLIQNGDFVRGSDTNDFARGKLNQSPATGATGYGVCLSDGEKGLILASKEMTEITYGSSPVNKDYILANLSCNPGHSGFGQQPMIEFVIAPAPNAPDASETYRQAWNAITPLRAGPPRSGPLGAFDQGIKLAEGDANSFIKVESPHVAVLALKKARNGKPNEYAIRLLEISGKKTKTSVGLPAGTKRAFLATQTEQKREELPLSDGAVSLELTGNQLMTLRLEL